MAKPKKTSKKKSTVDANIADDKAVAEPQSGEEETAGGIKKTEDPKTEESTASPAVEKLKCSKCGKRSAKGKSMSNHVRNVLLLSSHRYVSWTGCTQSACLACCDDSACSVHIEAREQAKWKDQVRAGTTPLQLQAKDKRSKKIPPGRFKESKIGYLGDTVVVWDLHQYMANPAWREDAYRKSKKRQARQLNHELGKSGNAAGKPIRKKSRKQRFADTMEALYQKSLSST